MAGWLAGGAIRDPDPHPRRRLLWTELAAQHVSTFDSTYIEQLFLWMLRKANQFITDEKPVTQFSRYGTVDTTNVLSSYFMTVDMHRFALMLAVYVGTNFTEWVLS